MVVNMNRFIIEDTVFKIARSLCDQHVVKMPLEECQMLCTTLWDIAPEYAEEHNLYKPVHQKHPCTLWLKESQANFDFGYALYRQMLYEYEKRYGKKHGAGKHHDAIMKACYKYKFLLDEKEYKKSYTLTKHPQCFSGHDELKTQEFFPINAYRAFYRVDKMRFARYKYTDRPKWFKDINQHVTMYLHRRYNGEGKHYDKI
tara:strand:- start:53 stop:655 length:603 start_codon:yes stop_codon:yes gene_type:complete